MLKHLIKFSAILLLLFVVACAGNSDTAVPAQSEQPEQPTAPTAIPTKTVATEPIEIEAVDPEKTENETENTAVEEEILPVASKPQFIEFYADW